MRQQVAAVAGVLAAAGFAGAALAEALEGAYVGATGVVVDFTKGEVRFADGTTISETFQFDSDLMTVRSPDVPGGSCRRVAGTYEYETRADGLHFIVLTDPCPERVQGFSEGPWVKLDERPA